MVTHIRRHALTRLITSDSIITRTATDPSRPHAEGNGLFFSFERPTVRPTWALPLYFEIPGFILLVGASSRSRRVHFLLRRRVCVRVDSRIELWICAFLTVAAITNTHIYQPRGHVFLTAETRSANISTYVANAPHPPSEVVRPAPCH